MQVVRSKLFYLLLAVLVTAVAVVIGAPRVGATNGNGQDEHIPVGVCHATSSDTNPYRWIVVDDDSVKYKGHLKHRNDPNKRWKSDGTWNGTTHKDGDSKRDFIEGLDDITEAACEGGSTPSPPPPTPMLFAAPTVINPTCESLTVAINGLDAAHVEYDVIGTPAPGATVTVILTAEEGYIFEDGDTVKEVELTFGSVPTNCSTPTPPPGTPTPQVVVPTPPVTTPPALVPPVVVATPTAPSPTVTTPAAPTPKASEPSEFDKAIAKSNKSTNAKKSTSKPAEVLAHTGPEDVTVWVLVLGAIMTGLGIALRTAAAIR